MHIKTKIIYFCVIYGKINIQFGDLWRCISHANISSRLKKKKCRSHHQFIANDYWPSYSIERRISSCFYFPLFFLNQFNSLNKCVGISPDERSIGPDTLKCRLYALAPRNDNDRERGSMSLWKKEFGHGIRHSAIKPITP